MGCRLVARPSRGEPCRQVARLPYPDRVLAVTRFRVALGHRAEFEGYAGPAVELFRTQPGLIDLHFGVNLDDPELWVLVTTWRDVGSYRRALGSANRPVLWPFLALAIDEPSAFDDPEVVGQNLPRSR